MGPGIMDIVHEGWLTKSPPPKRILKVRWRTRWFVLRSGELPGQFLLEYYVDQTRRKIKGTIDLDQCEQVDSGIVFAAPKDPSEDNFMFDIRTPNRLYYLRCETEQEMNRWVDCLCQVCGLKAQTDDMAPSNPILPHPPGPSHLPSLQPPNTGDSGHFSSPSSISNISGPYIPISECITGRKASTNNSNNQSNNSSTGASSRFPFQTSPNNRRMSIPTEMAPSAPLGPSSLNPSTSSLATTASSTSTLVADNHHLGGYGGRAGTTLTLPSSCGTKPRADGAQHSYDHPRSLRSSGGRHHTRSSGAISDEGVRSPQGTDSSSSVFTEEEWPSSIPHSAGGQSLFGGVDGSSWETDAIATHALRSHVKDANKIASLGLSGDSDKGAPPRPPKPAHLEVPQQNYMNIDTIVRATNSRKNSIADSSTRKLINVQNHDGTIASSSDAEPSPLSASSSLASGNTPGCVITEDQYEFPRSHARESMSGSAGVSDRPMRHCYNNAAPSSVTSDRVFSYDLRDAASLPPNELDPRISPALYTNIAALTIKSPVGPPSVDRGLKPKMSSSDGSSLSGCDSSPCITNSDSVGPPPSSAAPVVHRNLKPPSSKGDSNDIFGNSSAAVGNNVGVAPEFVLEPAPRSRPKGSSSNNDSRSGVTRAAPSPTPPSLLEDDMQTPPSSAHIFRNSVMQDEPVFFSTQPVRSPPMEVQYLDLDLNIHSGGGDHFNSQRTMFQTQLTTNKEAAKKGCTHGAEAELGAKSAASTKVIESSKVEYQTVDFVKTEALTKMKKDIENLYKNNQT